MGDVVKIKLGEREFEIGGLTIRQCRDLRIGDATALAKDDGVGGWTNVYDVCIKTIAIAIHDSHPDVTEEDLWKLRATEDEIGVARKAILIKAGFRPPEPTIAEMRSTLAAKKNELAQLEKSLAERESLNG